MHNFAKMENLSVNFVYVSELVILAPEQKVLETRTVLKKPTQRLVLPQQAESGFLNFYKT